MENFRQFEAGPDPFGGMWQVCFKWLQTAISLRHSDTVDVKFILRQGDTQIEKTVALRHPDLLELSATTGRPMTDAWCARLAALHLKHIIESGEDLEKDLVSVSPEQLRHYESLIPGENPVAASAREGPQD
jgi:hypothetical protein